MNNEKSGIELGAERKVKLTPEQWQVHVAEQTGSGMSVAAYCREKGLCSATFRNKLTKSSPSLRTLSLLPGSGILEVELTGKGVIRVMNGCPESWVVRVLEMAR